MPLRRFPIGLHGRCAAGQQSKERMFLTMVRAKFRVTEVTDTPGNESLKTIKLMAVTDGSEENKSFWKYTPAGDITMQCVNPDAIEQFEVGKEVYVDFTPAE